MKRKYGGRLMIALVVVAVVFIRYCSNKSINTVTGKTEYVSLTPEEEIALGLHSAPQMAQQFGGLYPDRELQNAIKQIGHRIVQNSEAARSAYQFDFHVLNDHRTVNAFALPGGQVFITTGLLQQLENNNQIAGVLGHEIGHVIERHGAERIAKQQLTQGLTGAAVVATGDYNTQQMAAVIGNLINMKYGRDDELESDDWGVKYMLQAGYNPSEMIHVMKVLKQASGGKAQAEFFSTHPDPENRIEKIQESIKKYKRELGVQ